MTTNEENLDGLDHNEGGTREEEGDDLKTLLAKALENYLPFMVKKIKETMEEAVKTTIADMITEALSNEFDRRLPHVNVEGENLINEGGARVNREIVPSKPYSLKDFKLSNPPTYTGDLNPIVSSRWISDIEGCFRTTRCPNDLKTTFGTCMLRGVAQR
ncbi:uncharacterized protein [Rutidosis leptorrhynchoides]|uniref:uncharacterized protein n=1 Tax=Rutidosis leptorrhynchoides TaxID=125765 RepID=UPI003A996A53